MQLLQKLVDAQVAGAASSGHSPKARGKVLAHVNLPEFHGGSSVSARDYRDWKRNVKAIQIIHELQPHELAMKIWLACRGDARKALEFIEPTDLQGPDALQIFYKVLDSQCEQLSHERRAEVYT